MAITDTLPSGAVEQIAIDLAELLPSHVPVEKLGLETEIAETFSLWYMGLDDIQNNVNFRDAIINTGRWHSQIKQAGEYVATTQSISLGNDWQVRQFFFGNLPKHINNIIDIVDNSFDDTVIVRLLEIPAYQITGFWASEVDGGNYVIPATNPHGLNVEVGQIYDADEFLNLLKSTEPLVGIEF